MSYWNASKIAALVILSLLLTPGFRANTTHLAAVNVRAISQSSEENKQGSPLPADLSKAVVESTLKRNSDAAKFGSWGYARALYLLGQYLVYKRTGDPRYFEFIKSWIDTHVDENGKIDRNINSLDDIQAGNLMVLLYRETKQEKYKIAAETIRRRLDTYPRTSDGGFWHASGESRKWQLWSDGTFMVLPFLVRYGQTFGDNTYAADEAAKQLIVYGTHLQDTATGLLYHAYDESGASKWADPVTHRSSEFWCRAMGWYGMAMTDVLEALPPSHTKRAQLIGILQNLVKGLAQYQDKKTGLWYQVVDKGSLPENWLETSSSSMYTYTISMAVERGYVDKKYKEVATRGYRGVLSKISLDADGLTNIADICEGTNVADLAYYLARKRNGNDFHGLGAFLLMNEQSMTTRSSVESDAPRKIIAPQTKTVKVAVRNPTSETRIAEDIVLNVPQLKRTAPDFDAESAVITVREPGAQPSEVPFQADDLDGDGNADEVAFQVNLRPKQTRIVTISYGDPSANASRPYPERTHAKFTKHFDGLGWESEMTAWRVYFDKRNAIDLFGKRKHGLYLEMFGQPDYKYQDESTVGRDIYNVGDSAGIGAVGALADRNFIRIFDVADRSWRIVSSGPLRTIVELTYKQWKVGKQSLDLTSRITQWAGERGFEHRVTISRGVGPTLVAALPRGPGFETSLRGGTCSMSTWGPQVVKPGARQTESLSDQNLGLAVLVPSSSMMGCAIATDPSNYLAQLFVKNGTAAWYALAAWDQEEKDSGAKVIHPDPVTTAGDFARFVKAQSMRLVKPATVALSPAQPEKQMF